ncbi:MAG: hypothetical protein JSU07_08695 [Bacteroidetes bacterium]|nr:hypothetical protein [Bacteroidota bacterium]
MSNEKKICTATPTEIFFKKIKKNTQTGLQHIYTWYNLILKSALVFVFFACSSNRTVVNQNPPKQNPNYQEFYDELSPYGQWVDYPGYGYVWIPNAGANFRPYSNNGHWVMTNYGWTWVSNYQWGWAPFHYGRWMYDNNYNSWLWIPGNTWGPAWVSWRQSSGYYGWAPLSPNMGSNVNISIGNQVPTSYWTFVPNQYIASTSVHNYYVGMHQNVTIINNSTVINNSTSINNVSYNSGPKAAEVEQFTHTNITPITVSEHSKPGHSFSEGQLSLYRPSSINQNINTGVKPAPKNAISISNYKPPINEKTNHTEHNANENERHMQPNDNNLKEENAEVKRDKANEKTKQNEFKQNNKSYENKPQFKPKQGGGGRKK